MKKILCLVIILFSFSVNAQVSNNIPITQYPSGVPTQATDLAHIARCNYAGCDYKVPLGGSSSAGQILWNSSGAIGGLNIGSGLQINGSVLSTTTTGSGGGYTYEQLVNSGTSSSISTVATNVIWDSSASGNKTENIPAAGGTGQIITITDAYGNAGTYPITAVPASGNIIGNASVYTNYGSITIYDSKNLTQWISQ